MALTTHSPRQPFAVISGDASSSVVIHVPHASTYIPAAVREGISLADSELVAEAVRMADVATDQLAMEAATGVSERPWLLVNQTSRLVVDPERFPDAREPMNTVGMGAVYQATSAGGVLRQPDDHRDAALFDQYFRPYAAAMEQLVATRLEACGRCTILDLHSYPRDPLPYEPPDAPRPPVCLGTDPFHTPAVLLAAVRAPFIQVGEVRLDTPFAGTYVPLRFYEKEKRVASIMVELRRDIYGWGDRISEGWGLVTHALEQVIQGVGELGTR